MKLQKEMDKILNEGYKKNIHHDYNSETESRQTPQPLNPNKEIQVNNQPEVESLTNILGYGEEETNIIHIDDDINTNKTLDSIIDEHGLITKESITNEPKN